MDIKKINKKKKKKNNFNFNQEWIDNFESDFYESIENSSIESDASEDSNYILKKKKIKKEKKCKMGKLNLNLKQLVLDIESNKEKVYYPNYINSKSKFNYEVGKICYICCSISNYKCVICDIRYCSKNCNEIHKDSICSIANISYN